MRSDAVPVHRPLPQARPVPADARLHAALQEAEAAVARLTGVVDSLEAELARRTVHDALTGLPNRSHLSFRLDQDLADARRAGHPVAVLQVDLDQFRAVDDVHGHLVGDQVLVRVAERLRGLAGAGDTVARLGGDEFVLVCPDLDVDGAGRLAELVMAAVSAPITVEGRCLRIGASVGIAVSPPLDDDAETMLKHAEAAVDEAKTRGRARSQVSDPALVQRARDQRRLAADLRDALARDDLEVHYQPVVDLAEDRLVALEALARWYHPAHGWVSPGTFVPLAESHGFAADLDRWVLDHATRETAEQIASGGLPPHVQVAVNLSARSLDDVSVVASVVTATTRAALPPESLLIEVTETAVLQNKEVARQSLEALRALGVGIALDDFGTGYSSLSFLRELPVTAVKIDRSFVREAHQPGDLAIVEAVVRLAGALGLETIAEGIETADQHELLRRLGCTSGQGYWWSAAVPMPELCRQSPSLVGRPAHLAPVTVLPTAGRTA